MPIDKNAKICMTLKSETDIELFRSMLTQNGIKNIKTFTSCNEAYENASRTQYDMFLTAIQLNDNPGIVLLQRLRHCGNYGFEPHLFVGDKVDSQTSNLFAEHDIEYVLTKPYSPDRTVGKMFHIFKAEGTLSPEEAAYRNAKSAYNTEMIDMAWDMAQDAEKKYGLTAKLEMLIGDIYLAKGKAEDARKRYENAIKKNPDSVYAMYKIATTHMAEKNFDAAKKMLDRLAKENPHHIRVLENAGLSNYETGNLDLAENQMKQVQKMDRSSKVANTVITQVKVSRGEVDGVAEALSKTHTEEELVRVLNAAGVKLSKEEKVPEAIQIYQDCLKYVKNGEYAGKIHYNLGLGYSRLGKVKEATEHLQKALQFIPNFEKAAELLKRVRPKGAA